MLVLEDVGFANDIESFICGENVQGFFCNENNGGYCTLPSGDAWAGSAKNFSIGRPNDAEVVYLMAYDSIESDGAVNFFENDDCNGWQQTMPEGILD